MAGDCAKTVRNEGLIKSVKKIDDALSYGVETTLEE
jgi:hypothetical protein